MIKYDIAYQKEEGINFMKNLSYDICILGSGPAGIASALAARRLGAKVLIVERNGVLGGMSTAGMLNTWCGDAYSSVFEYICSRTTKNFGKRRIYSPEELKVLLIEMLTEAKVDILLHSLVTGVECDNGILKEVHIHTKSGEIAISAGSFIDCTGDGDVAALSGVAFDKGRDDGLMQPMTVEFTVCGVDSERAVFTGAMTPERKAKMQEYLADGRVSFPVGLIILLEAIEPGVAFVNMTNVINVDGTNVFDQTRAELEARRQIPQIVRFLRENVPGYENCHAIASAAYAGARETRRIKGRYTLTANDIQEGTVFEDWIADGAKYCFGIHNPNGKLEKDFVAPHDTKRRYSIPYGCITPEGMKNLLVAGRCISGDYFAHSSYRVMPICFAMGEGAGTCAAIAMRDGVNSAELSRTQIKEAQALIKKGLYHYVYDC